MSRDPQHSAAGGSISVDSPLYEHVDRSRYVIETDDRTEWADANSFRDAIEAARALAGEEGRTFGVVPPWGAHPIAWAIPAEDRVHIRVIQGTEGRP